MLAVFTLNLKLNFYVENVTILEKNVLNALKYDLVSKLYARCRVLSLFRFFNAIIVHFTPYFIKCNAL